MRVLMGDTNDHTVTSTTIAIADAATRYFRFYLFPDASVTATADDTFNIFELQQAGGTVEVSLGMRITAASNLLEIGIGDGTAPTSFTPINRNKWICVELLATISTAGAGVVTLYLDGGQAITLTSQTHAAAIGQGVLGTQDTLSTTSGGLYFDQFVMDDARVYPINIRYPWQVPLSKSGHVFVGPGAIEGAELLSPISGTSMALYDTDSASSLDELSFVAYVSADGGSSVSGPLVFTRGCYAKLAGTNPYGLVHLVTTSQKPGMAGPLYYNPGAIKRYATLRKPRPQNV